MFIISTINKQKFHMKNNFMHLHNVTSIISKCVSGDPPRILKANHPPTVGQMSTYLPLQLLKWTCVVQKYSCHAFAVSMCVALTIEGRVYFHHNDFGLGVFSSLVSVKLVDMMGAEV